LAAKIRYLADEQFKSAIVDGVKRRLPELEITRVQDVGLRTASDPEVLRFAALENYIVLTHDVRTMETFARNRIEAGLPMPGVFVIPQLVPIGQAIDALALIAQCSQPEEWTDLIQFLPL